MASVKRRNFVVKHCIETVSHKGGKHPDKKKNHINSNRKSKYKVDYRNLNNEKD